MLFSPSFIPRTMFFLLIVISVWRRYFGVKPALLLVTIWALGLIGFLFGLPDLFFVSQFGRSVLSNEAVFFCFEVAFDMILASWMVAYRIGGGCGPDEGGTWTGGDW